MSIPELGPVQIVTISTPFALLEDLGRELGYERMDADEPLDRPQEGVLRVSQQALLDMQRSMNPPGPVNSSWELIPETNPEGACSANEIPVGTHGFQLADGVTDFDRANLRARKRDHFPELTRSDQFHRCCAED
jgi:hypothetical protein